jgi:steroid 5-alpha reductase family enzyme
VAVSPRSRPFAVCAVAYALALAAAVACAVAMQGSHPLAVALAADVVATVVVFGASRAFDNSSLYDPYWSAAPLPIAAYFAAGAADGVPPARQLLVIALVAAWALRLTWNWARSWEGLHHEDWRYRDKRREAGRLYWPVSFLGIHLMPTLLVFAGCLALYPALATGTRPLGLLDLAGVIVTGGAIWLEAIADQQLLRFRQSRPPREAFLESGLWARCRHPNYLGEIGFWWGLYLFALAADPSAWWTGVGAVSITLLFRFVSLGLIDRRMLERRPEYKRRLESTPALIPRWRDR